MHSRNDAEQIKLTIATGAAVDTNIAIAGIVKGDLINSIVSRTAAPAYTGNHILNATTLSAGSTTHQIASTAFQFAILGVPEAKGAVAAGTAFSAADTINTGAATGQFWGAWLVQITTGGTISTKSVGADQVYATEAEAIAALPEADTGNVAMGYVTVQSNTDVAWTAGTDDLVAESDCADVNFYSAASVADQTATLDASAFAVTSDGNIQSATVDTTGLDLFIVWIDRSEG